MKTTLLAAVLLLGPLAQAVIEVKTLPVSGKVQFEAIGRPSMIKIKGEGEGATSRLQLSQNKISGEITFNLDTLKTGIGLRDEHMKEKYLQVKTHPLAKLRFNDFQLPLSWTLQNPALTTANFRATLSLHGIDREITGTYTIEGTQLKSKAQFEIKLSDFKIDIPVYMGVKVADVVKINVTFDKMNVIKTN